MFNDYCEDYFFFIHISIDCNVQQRGDTFFISSLVWKHVYDFLKPWSSDNLVGQTISWHGCKLTFFKSWSRKNTEAIWMCLFKLLDSMFWVLSSCLETSYKITLRRQISKCIVYLTFITLCFLFLLKYNFDIQIMNMIMKLRLFLCHFHYLPAFVPIINFQ